MLGALIPKSNLELIITKEGKKLLNKITELLTNTKIKKQKQKDKLKNS